MITAKSMAIVCATMGRPDKIRNLIASIAENSIHPGQILIADGGHNLKSVVAEFSDTLNLTCLYCPEKGQIVQRNFAHQHLASQIHIVLHLDDDIILYPDALRSALSCWNNLINKSDKDLKSKPLAGMALNIVGHPRKKNDLFRNLALMKVEPQGRVWCSGFASPHAPVDENCFTDWLIGGATMWSREVLGLHEHPLSFRTRWAFCEDVLFSYPLSKTYRLAVCAEALVEHNDSYVDHTFSQRIFYARTQVLMRNYLIFLNIDLSKMAFVWMTVCLMFGYFAKGLFVDIRNLGSFLGTFVGLVEVLLLPFAGVSPEKLVRRLAE